MYICRLLGDEIVVRYQRDESIREVTRERMFKIWNEDVIDLRDDWNSVLCECCGNSYVMCAPKKDMFKVYTWVNALQFV